ncbi:ferredoxin [Streptomyces griseus]|uniref:ferredoxin n=1 Tax=Streptomyces griseus TaxID=1911 RepID=UPI0004CB5607|nr:ferredoxin [Streptomyces griseus]
MTAPRLTADRDRCIGAGMCAMTAPEVFDQDDDGLVLVLRPDPSADDRTAARLAVGLCPSGALALHDPAAGNP